MAPSLVWESNPGPIGGRRVLSALRQPCTQTGKSSDNMAKQGPQQQQEVYFFVKRIKEQFRALGKGNRGKAFPKCIFDEFDAKE